MWLFRIILVSANCIPFECINLGSNVCARKSLSTIMINTENYCDSNSTCLASNLEILQGTTEESLFCTLHTNDTDYNWDSFTYECGARKTGKNFKNGGKVIDCVEDADCKLTDGNFTSCQCGANGKKYCIPAWDSNVFDDFWSQCEEGLSHDQLKFWTFYKDFYPIWVTISDLDCVSNTILEFYLMEKLEFPEISTGIFLFILSAWVLM